MFLKLFLSKLIETCPDMARSKDLKICHPMVTVGCLCGLPSYIPKALWMWTPVNVLSFTQDHFLLHANLVSECRLDKLEWQVSWKKNRGNQESNPRLLGCESTNLYPCQNLNHFSLFQTFILWWSFQAR